MRCVHRECTVSRTHVPGALFALEAWALLYIHAPGHILSLRAVVDGSGVSTPTRTDSQRTASLGYHTTRIRLPGVEHQRLVHGRVRPMAIFPYEWYLRCG